MSFETRFAQAENDLSRVQESVRRQARRERILALPNEMVHPAKASGFAHEIVVLLKGGVGSFATAVDVADMVLSAVCIVFAEQTVAKSATPIRLPQRGMVEIAAFMAKDAAGKAADPLEVTVKGRALTMRGVSLAASSGRAAATDSDALGMLALAVYAAGKGVTDDNKTGFFGDGTDGGVRGRAGALMAVCGATSHYLTGDRALTQGELAKIHAAFRQCPAHRLALFSMLSAASPAPATPGEQVVLSQARLLTSEGRGSFERALTVARSFNGILKHVGEFRSEMEMVLLAIGRLAQEDQYTRDYGFLIYQDAYTTLRVSQFPRLATLGALIAQETSLSAANIKLPLKGDDLAMVEKVHVYLSEMAKAQMEAAMAELRKAVAA